MAIIASMTVLMGMVMRVTVFMVMRMAVISFAAIGQMPIKLHPINRALLPTISTERVALQL